MSGKRTRSFKCAVHQRDREVCSENDFQLVLSEPPLFRKMVHAVAVEVLPEERDRKYYADRYTCCPPPLFIILITILEVGRSLTVSICMLYILFLSFSSWASLCITLWRRARQPQRDPCPVTPCSSIVRTGAMRSGDLFCIWYCMLAGSIWVSMWLCSCSLACHWRWCTARRASPAFISLAFLPAPSAPASLIPRCIWWAPVAVFMLC